MERYRSYFREMSKASAGNYIYSGYISVLENNKIKLKPVEATIFKDSHGWRLNISDNKETYESGQDAVYRGKAEVLKIVKDIFKKDNSNVYYYNRQVDSYIRLVKGEFGYDEVEQYL